MADPSPETTRTTEAPASPTPGVATEAEEGVNLPLLGVLLLILVLVSLSNVWLRRRAERENRAAEQEGDESPGSR